MFYPIESGLKVPVMIYNLDLAVVILKGIARFFTAGCVHDQVGSALSIHNNHVRK